MTRAEYRSAFREAAAIVVASVILGFSYTAIMEKGFFAKPAEPEGKSGPLTVSPPEFISLDEAKQLHGSGSALFLDSRLEYDYSLGHIQDAVNFPLKEFDARKSLLAEVAKDRIIVSYCDGADCNSSIELASKLSELGFSKVKIFFGGWNEWQSHNMAIEK